VKDLKFHYPGTEKKPVLEDSNFTIETWPDGRIGGAFGQAAVDVGQSDPAVFTSIRRADLHSMGVKVADLQAAQLATAYRSGDQHVTLYIDTVAR